MDFMLSAAFFSISTVDVSEAKAFKTKKLRNKKHITPKAAIFNDLFLIETKYCLLVCLRHWE